MTIRENLEQWEKDYLSPYASLSVNSKGRLRPEEQCDIRPVFQRDRDRIIHCKAFRRLKDKTQVFLTPEGDHYRTRLTHTLEVSQTARTIAKALKLNEDLVEAIALGHDLGHTPFGHAGERALNRVCPFGFEHAERFFFRFHRGLWYAGNGEISGAGRSRALHYTGKTDHAVCLCGLCRKGSEGIQRTGAAQHLLKPFSLQYLQSLRRRRVQFLGRLLLHGGTDPVAERLERILVVF